MSLCHRFFFPEVRPDKRHAEVSPLALSGIFSVSSAWTWQFGGEYKHCVMTFLCSLLRLLSHRRQMLSLCKSPMGSPKRFKLLPASPLVLAVLVVLFGVGELPAAGLPTNVVRVPEVPEFLPTDWNSLRKVFARSPVLEFDQPWLERRQKGFRKGFVRLGWRGDRLYYYADLRDRERYTLATRHNENLWQLGDVLEIFAGIHNSPSYIEYHTAPNGIRLQLFWPEASSIRMARTQSGLDRMKRNDATSRSFALPKRDGWLVFGWITAEALGLQPGSSLRGRLLDLNFGRYDASPATSPAILSSTSPLSKPSFHRRHEWLQVLLEPAP